MIKINKIFSMNLGVSFIFDENKRFRQYNLQHNSTIDSFSAYFSHPNNPLKSKDIKIIHQTGKLSLLLLF